MAKNKIRNSCGNACGLGDQGIFGIPTLLILGHIQRNNYTLANNLLLVVEEPFQSLLHTLLVTQATKGLSSLMTDHASFFDIAQGRGKSRNGCRMRQLSENKGDLVTEQGGRVSKPFGEREHRWLGGRQIRRGCKITKSEHGTISDKEGSARIHQLTAELLHLDGFLRLGHRGSGIDGGKVTIDQLVEGQSI